MKRKTGNTFYGKLKIQSKLFLIITLAVLIPVVLIIFSFSGKLYDLIVADTIRAEQSSSAMTAPLISSTITEVQTASKTIQATAFYKSLCQKPVNHPLTELFASDSAASFTQTIQELEQTKTIHAIRVYLDYPANDPVFDAAGSNYFLPLSEVKGTYWYGIFQGSGYSSLFCPQFYLGSKEQTKYGDCSYVFSSSMTIQGAIKQCYIALYFTSDALQKTLTEHLVLDGSVSYITNNRDAIVTTTDRNLSGIYYLTYDTIQNYLMSSNSFIEKQVLGETVYVGFSYISSADWFLVTVLPSKPLMKKAYTMLALLFGVCLGSLLIGILISFWLSHSLIKRIVSVSRQMSQVKSGQLLPLPDPVCMDEIGDLVDSYNYMSRKITSLMEEQKKASEELRIAEFNSLQAQINPHFLYNTMDMINWLSKQGRTDAVTLAVQKLSRYYRLTLQNKNKLSTIEKELEHISIYIDLQNMRFNNTIELVADLSDDLLEYQIPKLTLQPIIENSILHGILEKEVKSGTIILTGWMEDENIILLISDDGIGMNTRQLSLLLRESNDGKHIAIYNTHRRLQILYGDDYGLAYTSTPGIGTEVTITLPAIKN